MAEVKSSRIPRFNRPSQLDTLIPGGAPSTTGRTVKGPISPFGTGGPARPGARSMPRSPNRPHSSPTVEELAKALILLDTDRDGKIWESDLDKVVNLAFGAQISAESPESSLSDVSKGWADVKEQFVGIDGMVKLAPLITAMKSGDLFTRISSLAQKAPKVIGSLGPFGGVVQYVAMFERFDTDKNGIICAKDLKKALEVMKGKELSIEGSRNLIEKVEPNKRVVDLAGFGALASTLLGCSTSNAMTALTEEEDECCEE